MGWIGRPILLVLHSSKNHGILLFTFNFTNLTGWQVFLYYKYGQLYFYFYMYVPWILLPRTKILKSKQITFRWKKWWKHGVSLLEVDMKNCLKFFIYLVFLQTINILWKGWDVGLRRPNFLVWADWGCLHSGNWM